ncbi:MAG: EAL domain-containing protein [Halothece sp.]
MPVFQLLHAWLLGDSELWINSQLLAGILITTFSLSAIAIIVVIILVNRRLKNELKTRKQVEENLKQTQEEFQNFIKNIPGALLRYVLETDGSHKIAYMSPAVAKIWKIPESEVGESAEIFWQYVHPDDFVTMRQSVIASAESLQPWFYQWRIITPSGITKYLQGRGNPQKREDGAVVWDTVIVDITEQNLIKEALQESQEQLQNMTNAIPGAVYQYKVDLNGNEEILFMSEGIRELFGISPQEMINNPDLRWEVIPTEARSRLKSATEYSAITLSPFSEEFETHLEDGQKKWIKVQAMPKKLEDESIIWNGILVDISQEKWQENLLKTQQEILEALAIGENLDKILTQLMRLIEQQAEGLMSSVYLVSNNYLYDHGKSILPTGYLEKINGVPIREGMGSCGTAAARGELVISKDIKSDPFWKEIRDIPLQYNLKACWSIPIISSTGEVLGTFSVYSDVPRSPSHYEKDLIEIASKLAKLAIEQKQQEETLKKQAEQEKLLGKITQQIRRSLDLEVVLNTTVTEVRTFLKTDRVVIYSVMQNPGEVIAEAVGNNWKSLYGKKFNDPCLRQVSPKFPVGYTQSISDVNDPAVVHCYAKMLRENQVQANLAIPIFQEEELWGFLIAQQCSHSRQWQQEEIKFLENLSEQVEIAIQQARLFQQTQTELLKGEELATQLRHEAMHDKLTQLPNRSLLMDRLQHVFQLYRRYNNKDNSFHFALLFLDLNRFKIINDTLGHDAGDQILMTAAEKLKSCLREMDTVSRLGGDEFVIILEGITGEENAIEVANRIQDTFAIPTSVYGQEICLSASIGIVMDNPNYMYPEEMLRDADVAMYEAKKNQLNYVVFRPSMQTTVAEDWQLETDFRRALEQKQLSLYYQPIFDLRSQKIQGFEAFMGWQHPEKGWIEPSQFLAMAEQLGLMEEIELWSLKEACSQFKDWQDEFLFLKDTSIHINISLNNDHQNKFVKQVQETLSMIGLASHALKLEITEISLMQKEETAQKVLEDLEALGVKICLDDFGVGYSSLSYLSQFPIHELKVDSRIIQAIDQEEIGKRNRQIVKAIASLCNNLNISAIAEGVETQDQSLILTIFGYQTAQGYYFCEPLSADKITTFLSNTVSEKSGYSKSPPTPL